MKNHRIPTLALGAVLGGAIVLTATSVGGCGKKGEIVALVNGQSITMDEFVKYMELKPDIRVRTTNGSASLPVDGYIGFQALQDLVAQQATLQLAADKKMEPTDQDITKEIDFQKKLRPNFMTQLTERGLTLQMIRQNIKIDLIQERLLTEGITVTLADVDKYIKEHPKEFIEQERADVSWILVQDGPTKTKVDQDLNTQQFSQVANKYSKAPGPKNGGRLVDQNTGQAPVMTSLPADVVKMLRSTREGSKTDWIRFADGYAKFLLHRVVPPQPVSLDANRKEYLRRAMARDKGALARDINRQILNKLKTSQISILLKAYEDDWKTAFDQFKTENKLEDLTGSRGN